MSTVASEKTRKLLEGIVVYRPRVLQTVTSSIVIRGHDLLTITNLNLQRESDFRYGKKNSSQRERRKWSLGLGHNLKALGLTCVRSQSSREINNATKSEFSTFLKTNKPRIQFLLRSTRFYPG